MFLFYITFSLFFQEGSRWRGSRLYRKQMEILNSAVSRAEGEIQKEKVWSYNIPLFCVTKRWPIDFSVSPVQAPMCLFVSEKPNVFVGNPFLLNGPVYVGRKCISHCVIRDWKIQLSVRGWVYHIHFPDRGVSCLPLLALLFKSYNCEYLSVYTGIFWLESPRLYALSFSNTTMVVFW